MKKKHLLFIALYLFSTLTASAKKTTEIRAQEFDSIYFDTAVNWAKKDYVKALSISDSLYKHSPAPLHKLKALMLSASIYQQLGKQEESIKWALKAEEIASDLRDYDWQAKISGFLSTQYRNLGLWQSGKRALERGIKIIQKVEGEKKKIFYYGLVNQEWAYYEIDGGNFDKAKTYIKESIRNFERLDTSPNILYYKATNEELLAKCDLNLGQYDTAEQHYDQALIYLDESSLGESVLRGLIFSGKAKILQHKKDYTKALDYFEQAEILAISSGFVSLKFEVYKELSNYYKEVGDLKNYEVYLEKYNNLFQSTTVQSQTTLDGIFTKIAQNNEQLEYRQYWFAGVIVLLLVCVFIGFIFHKLRKKKDRIRFNKIIADLKAVQKQQLITANPNLEPVASESANVEKVVISKHMETKILRNLEDFEMGFDYLDKNISASFLATKLETTTKYLSIILKNHRNKDFNNYIGGLRIQYIIQKLVNQPEYKNYKISYLAEECGFSTHSKFTAVFKKHMGITPSVFLENLEN